MGEIAEMMMDGTLCAGCGELMGAGDAPGFPGYCTEECAPKPADQPKKRKKKTAAQRKARALKQRRRRARKRVAAEMAEEGS